MSDTQVQKYVVRLEDRADETVSADDAHTIYGRCHHHTTTLHDGDGSFVYCELTQAEAQQLEQRPCVKDVEPDKEASTCAEEKNGSTQSQQTPYGVIQVNANYCHEQDIRGGGVSVGVVDSGIDANHTDLNVGGGQTWLDSQTAPPPWNDDNNHGTHCAGIVSAKSNDVGVLGVAPDTDVYAYKVLSSNGFGTYANISAGIVQAVDDGRDIISCSIGGTEPYGSLRDAVQYAEQEGVPTIVSAGNNSCTDCVQYPAAYPETTAVSATDDHDDVASFVSKGPEIDIAAPGVDVPSTIPGGYSNYDGTSMATPHVSGAIALLSSVDGISPMKALSLLHDTAIDISHPDTAQGSGRIDVQAAYEQHKSGPMNYPHTLTIDGSNKNTSDTSYYTFKLKEGGAWTPTDTVDESDHLGELRVGGQIVQGRDTFNFGPEDITFDPGGCNITGVTDDIQVLINGTDYGPNGRDIGNFNTEQEYPDKREGGYRLSDGGDVRDVPGARNKDRIATDTTDDIVLWLDPDGSDDAVGSKSNPIRTPQEAIRRLPQNWWHDIFIYVKPGTYDCSGGGGITGGPFTQSFFDASRDGFTMIGLGENRSDVVINGYPQINLHIDGVGSYANATIENMTINGSVESYRGGYGIKDCHINPVRDDGIACGGYQTNMHYVNCTFGDRTEYVVKAKEQSHHTLNKCSGTVNSSIVTGGTGDVTSWWAQEFDGSPPWKDSESNHVRVWGKDGDRIA